MLQGRVITRGSTLLEQKILFRLMDICLLLQSALRSYAGFHPPCSLMWNYSSSSLQNESIKFWPNCQSGKYKYSENYPFMTKFLLLPLPPQILLDYYTPYH